MNGHGLKVNYAFAVFWYCFYAVAGFCYLHIFFFPQPFGLILFAILVVPYLLLTYIVAKGLYLGLIEGVRLVQEELKNVR